MRALRLVHVLHRVCARPQSCLTAGMFPSKWYDPARRLPELSRLKRAICLNLPTLTVHFVALNEKDANRRAAPRHGGGKKSACCSRVSPYTRWGCIFQWICCVAFTCSKRWSDAMGHSQAVQSRDFTGITSTETVASIWRSMFWQNSSLA